MAAYAALLSLGNMIDQIQVTEPNLDPDTSLQLEFLHGSVAFFRGFLEDDSENIRKAVKWLEPNIRDAAYKAEDVIESRISSHQHHAHSLSQRYWHKVVSEIDSIRKELTKISERFSTGKLLQENELPIIDSTPAVEGGEDTIIVGFDHDLWQLKYQLFDGGPSLKITPIIGMAGSGKTTLAKMVYYDPVIIRRFEVRFWIKVSQNPVIVHQHSPIPSEKGSNYELGELSYKALKGRRYLIVMDDVCRTDIWDGLKRYFPDDHTHSRILATTRLTYVADLLSDSWKHHSMRVLTSEESWRLLQRKVFRLQCCPPELEDVGCEIAKKCGGLPLTITQIAEQLSRFRKTQDFWEHVAKHVSAYANTNIEQGPSRLLESYNYLTHHLRSCFLYMTLFPEGYEVRVSKLLKLLVAEGFIASTISEEGEKVVERYLMDLVKSNLVLIQGNAKTCKINDQIRDLCGRICREEKFLCTLNERDLNDIPDDIVDQRRLAIHEAASGRSIADDGSLENLIGVVMENASHVRSLIFLLRSHFYFSEVIDCVGLELLRVLDAADIEFDSFPEVVFEMVHLRYLALYTRSDAIPSSISRLRRLQTLIICRSSSFGDPNATLLVPRTIWEMPLLRHVSICRGLLQPNPIIDGKVCNYLFLLHLQTLSGLQIIEFSDEMIERIPNVRRLKIWYDFGEDKTCKILDDRHQALYQLFNLESLSCCSTGDWMIMRELHFPFSLRKLTLHRWRLSSRDMSIIGLLPSLEVLKLRFCNLTDQIWEPVEGEFLCLRVLKLVSFVVAEWRAEYIHFPNLMHLTLEDCRELQWIPLGMAYIRTLEVIELINCNQSVEDAAREIQMEQWALGNDLRVIVEPDPLNRFYFVESD